MVGADQPLFMPLIRSAVTIPDSVAAVYITEELARRPAGRTDPSREKFAVRDLARQMAGGSGQVLPLLVDSALKLCDRKKLVAYWSRGQAH
jgi:hypothetical protein